jgi:hypothetical protein
MRAAVITTALVLWCSALDAQTLSQRGFLEGRGFLFPQTVPNDSTHAVGDVLFREEVFLKPAGWIQFAAGLDLRANSHDQVEKWRVAPGEWRLDPATWPLNPQKWRLDIEDRGVLRPRASIRRLTATVTARGLTVDLGKQFIRWARADILNPTDRFAPRDFLNVIDSEFLPVIAARPSLRVGTETFEAVWVPQVTPSRMPLLDQRWTALPPQAAGVSIRDAGSRFPKRAQYGARWSHTGSRFETALSYFDGVNHLPTLDVRRVDVVRLPVPVPPLDDMSPLDEMRPLEGVRPLNSAAVFELTRVFPRLRSYGADMAIPTRLFTLKVEAAYFTSPSHTFDEYGLYVVEVERQTGEWVLTGGYAGEVVTGSRTALVFDPERGVARSIIGRAAYTVDPQRTLAIEIAARQNGDGEYIKGEYSQAIRQYWRITLTGVGLAGNSDDFLGRYKRNSHISMALRFSF